MSDFITTHTLIVVIGENNRRIIYSVYSYYIDDLGILILKDGDGKITAAFKQWLYFEVPSAD